MPKSNPIALKSIKPISSSAGNTLKTHKAAAPANAAIARDLQPVAMKKYVVMNIMTAIIWGVRKSNNNDSFPHIVSF